jgi:DNA-binding MarR family transcriptional regulator
MTNHTDYTDHDDGTDTTATRETANGSHPGTDQGTASDPEEGPAYPELHAFQRDCLLAIAARSGPLQGTEVVAALTEQYGDTLTPSRVYQNLNALASQGLVTKDAHDERTNTYQLTPGAWALLDARYRRMKAAFDGPSPGGDRGGA